MILKIKLIIKWPYFSCFFFKLSSVKILKNREFLIYISNILKLPLKMFRSCKFMSLNLIKEAD